MHVNFTRYMNYENQNSESRDPGEAGMRGVADGADAWQRQLDEWRRLTGIDGLLSAVAEMERIWDEAEAREVVDAHRTGGASGWVSDELMRQDEVVGGGVVGKLSIKLSTILVHRRLSFVVARWCARVEGEREAAAGSVQQLQMERMSLRECRR